jgi:hypothetical protein
LSQEDQAIVEVRFRALTAEWRLTTMEAALLLGVDGESFGLDMVPRSPTSDACERMRLLVRLRDALPAVLPSTREASRWLRTFDENDLSPIVFMSHGRERIAAMIEAVDAYAARGSLA